jgi:1-deoxy-D-xylulose-5-phosphate reductoisomerase
LKTATVLGATGSVGRQTLDLLAARPGEWRVEALTGAANVALLAAEARRLGARLAVTARDDLLGELRDRLAGSGIEAAAGAAAVAEAAARPADWTMGAIVGAAGLLPNLEVLRRGGTLALANKETLVAAGPLVMATARAAGAVVLPVDSEHSGVFQVLRGEDRAGIERVVLTASGGAFRDRPLGELDAVTPEEAARHPTWAMGQRITVDSASMFNKALELIEARELFGLDPEAIEVVIHPESLVHAIVAFRDGGMIAHLGAADMRHAIGFALNHPERAPLPVARLDLAAVGRLTFRAPEPGRYPALALGRRAMAEGGLAGAVLNAAKERALDAFLAGGLAFTGMARVVEAVLDRMAADIRATRLGPGSATPTLHDILEADARARALAAEVIGTRGGAGWK